MSTSFVAKPFAGTDDDIERVASDVRRILTRRFSAEPTGSGVARFLTETVNLLGGSIEVSDAPTPAEEPGGSLTIEPGGRRFVIRLSPYTSPIRDHFTIGHELGHYFLHYEHRNPPDVPVSFHRYGTSVIETQANRFAAALLMPKDEFLRVWAEFNGDTYALAGHFGVSEPAVRRRADCIR